MRVISSPCPRQARDQVFWASASTGENPGRNKWHPAPCARHNEPAWLPVQRSLQSPPTLRWITDSDIHVLVVPSSPEVVPSGMGTHLGGGFPVLPRPLAARGIIGAPS